MDNDYDEQAFTARNAVASIRLGGGQITAELQDLADRYTDSEFSDDDLDTYARAGAGLNRSS